MIRARDYAYEALAEATNTDPTVGRGELNAALRDIRTQEPELATSDLSYELGDLIHLRAKQYRIVYPDVALTPNALAKHWTRVEAEVPKPTYTQPTPVTERCATCGGDHWVLVGRRADGHEEWAACPDCGRQDASFWRHDGTRFMPMDPALVRQRMQKAPALGKPAGDIPEWVFVWSWARRKGARRPFPQQADQGLDGEPLTEAEYEHLRQLWVAAGSPKPKDPIAVAMQPATKTITDVLDGVLS